MQCNHCISELRTAILRALAASTLAMVAAACASMAARTPDDYQPGRAQEGQFQKDAAACEKQAETNGKDFGWGPYDPTHGAYNRMYDMCMRSSGYQRKPPKE